jgi:cyanate lyase
MWAQLAEAVGRPLAWTTAALLGQHPMSAINFRLDVRREADPAGDRVVVVLDGKFLPYQW